MNLFVWGWAWSEESLREPVLSFYYAGLRPGMQVLVADGHCLYLLSHLEGSLTKVFTFLNDFKKKKKNNISGIRKLS